MGLHIWPPGDGVVGMVMEPLGGGALLEEIHHWEGGLRDFTSDITSSSLCFQPASVM